MAIKKPGRKKLIAIITGAIIMLLLIAVGIFLFTRYQNGSSNLGSSPEAGSAQENEELISKVGKLIMLPSEAPDIATVTDVNQLQDQTVFRNAQNGDKVLIFTQAKRAIVYRPSQNIIVEVGNIVVSPPEASSSATPGQEETKEVSVAVYNATSTAGYAGRVGNDLKSKFPNIQVIDTGNAVGDYETTLVIDITGENKEIVSNIAKELGGEVGSLPEDEQAPESDILIILGQ